MSNIIGITIDLIYRVYRPRNRPSHPPWTRIDHCVHNGSYLMASLTLEPLS